MAEDYARQISRRIVAQFAEREGFSLAHGNALDALADVMNRFIQEVGTYARDYAELQGRTDVNVLDVADGLQDLGYTPDTLLEYVQQDHSTDPCVHTVPEFPQRMLSIQPPSFKSSGIEPPAHIPTHLPAFPAKHTIKRTQPCTLAAREVEHATQPSDVAQIEQKHAETAQGSLIALHQRLQASSGATRLNPFLSFKRARGEVEKTESTSEQDSKSPQVWIPDIVNVLQSKDETTAQKPHESGRPNSDKKQCIRCEDGDANMVSLDEGEDTTLQVGWQSGQIDESTANQSAENFLGLSAGVSFSIEATSTAANNCLAERYSVMRKDSFLDSDLAKVGETGARRRITLSNPEVAKKQRALEVLDAGPDSILMEYPEGYVPRQGGQRIRDELAP